MDNPRSVWTVCFSISSDGKPTSYDGRFGEGVLIAEATAGGLNPRPSPMLATPNGNIPITQPLPISATTTVLDVHGQLNAKGERGRGANKTDRQQVDAAARQAGIQDRRGFGKYIEKIKGMEGRGGADNFTFEELLDLAADFKAQGGY